MQEVFVPALGMASDGVYLAEWVVQPGDTVSAGDIIALIETDKAELSVEAPASGVLGRHRFEAESTVPSGATIAVLLEHGESEEDGPVVTDAAPVAEAPQVIQAAAEQAPSSPRESATPLVPEDRRRDPVTRELEPYSLSPRARDAALRMPSPEPSAPSLEPESLQPAQRPQPTAALSDATKRHRAGVAAAVSRSWAEIPHFAVNREIRVDKLTEVYRGFKAISSEVSFTDVLLKAYALALVERMQTTTIDLGLATATPRGVAIPVLRDVARRDLLSIAASRRAAVQRAVDARLDSDDAIVPHSTLSNLGSFGVDSFTAIVPVGQTSILAVGATAARPAVVDGVLTVASTMHLTLNVDHREWDGQHAAEALMRFAAIAEQPAALLALD